MGYRLTDWTLLYTSPFISHVKAKTTIKQTDETISATTVTVQPDGHGDLNGLTFGLRFGKYFFVSTEGSLTQTQWTRENPSTLKSSKFSNFALGFVLGGSW